MKYLKNKNHKKDREQIKNTKFNKLPSFLRK